MPISSIITQPAANSNNAAYRPMVLRVAATNTDTTPVPPVVYCDVYFNGIFYKTFSKTQYDKLNTGLNTEWQFDIQDATQEYLQRLLGTNGGYAVLDAGVCAASVQCKFRSSGFDTNGLIAQEGTAPVQGTGNTSPVPGTGTASNTFFAINAALQHEDNQDLSTHLAAFKTRIWDAACYPLTHRPDGYAVTINDSDYFPVIVDTTTVYQLYCLKYKFFGQTTYRTAVISFLAYATGKKVLYLPAGPKNLQSMFGSIDFSQVSEYYTHLQGTGGNSLTSSVLYKIVPPGDDIVRIHFINYLGTVDAISLKLVQKTHATKSDSYQVANVYPLTKPTHSIKRFNTSSSDTYTAVTIDYDETKQGWLTELFDSPSAWIQWTGTQGQSDNYLPILITDAKTDTIKQDDRFVYEVSVDFTLSNQPIILRN